MSIRILCTLITGLLLGTHASALTEDEAATRLADFFRPKIFRLERELVTFHYAQAEAKFQPTTLPDVQWRILGRTERFFDPKISEMMLGPGTYVSIDASATRDYGGEENPQLFVIPLRMGGVVLDATGDLSETEEKLANGVLAALSCGSTSEAIRRGSSLDSVISVLRNHEKEDCRRLIVSTFRNLGVEAILYSYTGSGGLRDCRTNRSEALNVISKRIIDERRMSYYSDSKAIEGSPMAGAVLRLYREGIADFSLRISSELGFDRSPPKALLSATYPYPFYRAWKKSKIYKCGPPRAIEKHDAIDTLQDKMRETFYDPESANLMIRLHRAAFQRAMPGVRSFEITRFRKIEKMVYRLSGLAADDSKLENWQRAVDLGSTNEGTEDERAEKIATLLEEEKSVTLTELGSRVRAAGTSIVPSAGSQPGFVWQLILRAGVRPRRLQILENQMLVAFGGVPFIVDRFATDASALEKELLAKNREVFRAILRECVTEYEDASRTNEEILRGECGQRPAPL